MILIVIISLLFDFQAYLEFFHIFSAIVFFKVLQKNYWTLETIFYAEEISRSIKENGICEWMQNFRIIGLLRNEIMHSNVLCNVFFQQDSLWRMKKFPQYLKNDNWIMRNIKDLIQLCLEIIFSNFQHSLEIEFGKDR